MSSSSPGEDVDELEEMYRRPLMPQPETDEASRAYLSKAGYYTRLEAIEQLYATTTTCKTVMVATRTASTSAATSS